MHERGNTGCKNAREKGCRGQGMQKEGDAGEHNMHTCMEKNRMSVKKRKEEVTGSKNSEDAEENDLAF